MCGGTYPPFTETDERILRDWQEGQASMRRIREWNTGIRLRQKPE